MESHMETRNNQNTLIVPLELKFIDGPECNESCRACYFAGPGGHCRYENPAEIPPCGGDGGGLREDGRSGYFIPQEEWV